MMILTYEVGGEVKELTFDATAREVHSSTASATTHPVETGSAPADHVKSEPDRLSVEAWVSNTPIKATNANGGQQSSKSITYETSQNVGPGIRVKSQKVAGVDLLQFNTEFNRVRDVHAELLRLKATGTLVSIRTIDDKAMKGYAIGLKDYADMVIVSVSAPRDAQSGSAIAFSFDAQHISIVTTKKVKAEKEAPKKATKKKGEKGKKEVKDSDPKKKASIATRLTDYLGSLGAN